MLRRFDIHHLSMYSFSHGETRIPICLRSTNILGLNAIQLLKLLQHGPLALPGHRVKRCKFLDAIGTSSKNGQEYQKWTLKPSDRGVMCKIWKYSSSPKLGLTDYSRQQDRYMLLAPNQSMLSSLSLAAIFSKEQVIERTYNHLSQFPVCDIFGNAFGLRSWTCLTSTDLLQRFWNDNWLSRLLNINP